MPPHLTVWYNTRCPVCDAGIDWQRNKLLALVRAGTVEFKDINEQPDALARRLKRSSIARILRAELAVAATPAQGQLGGCGLIVVNPPWTLENELVTILPELVNAIGSRNSNYRLDWIAGEN